MYASCDVGNKLHYHIFINHDVINHDVIVYLRDSHVTGKQSCMPNKHAGSTGTKVHYLQCTVQAPITVGGGLVITHDIAQLEFRLSLAPSGSDRHCGVTI